MYISSVLPPKPIKSILIDRLLSKCQYEFSQVLRLKRTEIICAKFRCNFQKRPSMQKFIKCSLGHFRQYIDDMFTILVSNWFKTLSKQKKKHFRAM